MKQLQLIEIPASGGGKPCLNGCSMCCYDPHGDGRWVPVTAVDRDVPEQLVKVDENGRAWMRHRPDGGCVALEAGRCTIYTRRPLACRQYEPQTDCADMIGRVRSGETLPGAPPDAPAAGR